MSKDVDEGVDDHESKMTKMGFMFLGIFVGVIALAAFLP
jgi:type II secretory pathway component PulF